MSPTVIEKTKLLHHTVGGIEVEVLTYDEVMENLYSSDRRIPVGVADNHAVRETIPGAVHSWEWK